jgi:hypothetical protein
MTVKEPIPDYMKGFDLDNDWGFSTSGTSTSTPVQPTIDPSVIESTSDDIANIKSEVALIKVMLDEISSNLTQKDSSTQQVVDETTAQKFKDIEKIILPFLYNLTKSNEPYIHWPNRAPIIKAQIEKILKLTRG